MYCVKVVQMCWAKLGNKWWKTKCVSFLNSFNQLEITERLFKGILNNVFQVLPLVFDEDQ